MKNKFHHLKDKHLLVIMTIVCIVLILGTCTTNVVSSSVRNVAGYAVAPFQNGINKVGGWLTEQYSGFKNVKKVNAENASLQSQVDALTSENTTLMQQTTELSRLEALYQMDQEYPDYPKVGAEVIAKDAGNWYSTFTINKGTDDGIAVDMNVLGQSGLVGIVTDVGKSWATVRSIIDDESNVSAMAASTSDTCVVTGNLTEMDSGKIDFINLIDDNNEVTEGTTLVTSNISEKFLPGLLVGYVSDVSEDSNKLTKSGTLIPAVDFRTLREVLVITQLKQTTDGAAADSVSGTDTTGTAASAGAKSAASSASSASEGSTAN